jgi:sterol desaturase/sphingolipid hydroxylase (fatty acid hydroxylase superfamily)
MDRPLVFDLRFSACVLLAIAVFGPLAMLLLDACVQGAVSRGWLKRAAGGTVERLGIQDLKFMATFVLVTGGLTLAAQSVLFRGRSFPLDLRFHPLQALAFTILLMLVVDTNGFFWHRFSHRNRRAFRTFHREHHRTGHRIHVGIGFYSNTVWDYPLHSGISLSLVVSMLPFATGEYPIVTIVYAVTVYVLGIAATHSGLLETPRVKWALRVILLPIKILPTAIRLEDHQLHHARGNCNYGVFFSHWDCLLGSWVPATAACLSERPPHVGERFA